MDLQHLPEKDRKEMIQLIEAKQGEQFVQLYGFVLSECFQDCINTFHSDTLSSGERTCVTNCTNKLLKMTNRMGQLLAEKQQVQAPPQ